MLDWNAQDVQDWKAVAAVEQQNFYTMLGDREYDLIRASMVAVVLRKKVGFALYGPPGELPNEKNKHLGYSLEQLKLIKKICKKIQEKARIGNRSLDVYFAAIFISGKIFDDKFTEPLFRIAREPDCKRCYFVDSSCRVYDDWRDFLKNNKFPKCLYCYPRDGVYRGDSDSKVLIDYGTSPACDIVHRIGTFFDHTTTLVALGTTIVGVTALFVPVAGPLLTAAIIGGTATGVYGAGRSAQTLIDRAMHNQTVGLSESEARFAWLAIVGTTVGITASSASILAANLAKNGELVGKAGQIAVDVLKVGNLTVKGVGIVMNFAHLVHKEQTEQLNPLEIFQFSASVLFFSNAIVDMKTTGFLIKETKQNILSSTRPALQEPEAKAAFDRFTSVMSGQKLMHQNVVLVKSLENINTMEQFFTNMVDKPGDLNNQHIVDTLALQSEGA